MNIKDSLQEATAKILYEAISNKQYGPITYTGFDMVNNKKLTIEEDDKHISFAYQADNFTKALNYIDKINADNIKYYYEHSYITSNEYFKFLDGFKWNYYKEIYMYFLDKRIYTYDNKEKAINEMIDSYKEEYGNDIEIIDLRNK